MKECKICYSMGPFPQNWTYSTEFRAASVKKKIEQSNLKVR